MDQRGTVHDFAFVTIQAACAQTANMPGLFQKHD
jgi:hypothetical protein